MPVGQHQMFSFTASQTFASVKSTAAVSRGVMEGQTSCLASSARGVTPSPLLGRPYRRAMAVVVDSTETEEDVVDGIVTEGVGLDVADRNDLLPLIGGGLAHE